MTIRADQADLHGFGAARPALTVVSAHASPGARAAASKPPRIRPQPEHGETRALPRRVTLRGCLITLAALLLAGLATAMGVVSWAGQFGFIYDIKHDRLAAALEALGPDCGAIIFAILGIALALAGRRAVAERVLVCACSALSVLMNLGASDIASPRAIGVYVLPPALFAITSDRLIAVVRRTALRERGEASRSAWGYAGTALLYLLRVPAAPKATLAGLRRALLNATPLPGAAPQPVRAVLARPEPAAAITSNPHPVRKPQRARVIKQGGPTKTQQLIDLVTERHGPLAEFPLTDVSKVATAIAPEIDLHPGSARTALRNAVIAAQNRSQP